MYKLQHDEFTKTLESFTKNQWRFLQNYCEGINFPIGDSVEERLRQLHKVAVVHETPPSHN